MSTKTCEYCDATLPHPDDSTCSVALYERYKREARTKRESKQAEPNPTDSVE